MANPWFRMYHEFATDPKVQMLSETDQRRYIMLLCLKCCNGDVTLHETEIAFQIRISNEELSNTKQRLIKKGLVDEQLQPIAWDKRQFSSDSSAARVAKHREKKKLECNVTVTKSNALDADSDTNTDKRKEEEEKEKRPRTNFQIPKNEEVNDYAQERKLNLTGFFDYYESNGWMVGKNKMKNWKAAASGWSNRNSQFGGTHENKPTAKILARRNSK